MKILLIEDVRVERRKIKRWLERFGYEVIEASNGIEGLKLYHDHAPDLVISDIVMPESEGIQLITDLKTADPHATIFAMSGAGRERGEYLSLAEGIGAVRSFVKPIDKNALLKAIKEFFPDKPLLDEQD